MFRPHVNHQSMSYPNEISYLDTQSFWNSAMNIFCPLVPLFIPKEDGPVDHVEAGEAQWEQNQEHWVNERQLVTVPVTRLWRSYEKLGGLVLRFHFLGLGVKLKMFIFLADRSRRCPSRCRPCVCVFDITLRKALK